MRVTTVYASTEQEYLDRERAQARHYLAVARDATIAATERAQAVYCFESAVEYLIDHLAGTERAQWIATLYLATGRI